MIQLCEDLNLLYWVLRTNDPFKRTHEEYFINYKGLFFIGIINDFNSDNEYWHYNKLRCYE